ncbi:MAG: PASTA domain-containing protein [Actinomycetota bacterium]
MRPIFAALLVPAVLLAASCTGNEPTPSTTATSTIVSSTPSNSVTTVPDVVGLNVGAARHAITDAGLTWKLSVITGDYVHAAIVRQNPPPGTVLEPGAIVRIVSGPA